MTAIWTSPSPTSLSIAVGDIDGDLELLTGFVASNTLLLQRNTGAGCFVAAAGAVAPQAGASRSAVFADVDGHGDLDLLRTALNTAPPFGRLWLDLGVPNALKALLLPSSPFPTVRPFVLPNLPGIVGIELHAQALIEGPSDSSMRG